MVFHGLPFNRCKFFSNPYHFFTHCHYLRKLVSLSFTVAWYDNSNSRSRLCSSTQTFLDSSSSLFLLSKGYICICMFSFSTSHLFMDVACIWKAWKKNIHIWEMKKIDKITKWKKWTLTWESTIELHSNVSEKSMYVPLQISNATPSTIQKSRFKCSSSSIGMQIILATHVQANSKSF